MVPKWIRITFFSMCTEHVQHNTFSISCHWANGLHVLAEKLLPVPHAIPEGVITKDVVVISSCMHAPWLYSVSHVCLSACAQAFIQQLQPSQGVIISQEPWNKADRHAVAVLTAGMEHLGYLPQDLAQQWHSTVGSTAGCVAD
jgi:hypothetical protein